MNTPYTNGGGGARRGSRGALRAVCLAALFVCMGLMAAAGGAGEEGGEEGMDETRLTVAGIRSLEVEGAFFRVEVRGGAGTEVEARFEIPERLKARGVKVLHERRGSTLRVWVKRPPGLLSTAALKTPELIFRVPARTDLRVDNSSGAVSVAGLETDRVSLELSSGRCEVEDVRASLEVTTSSGSQEIRNCDGDKDLRASSGKIQVREADGDIRAVTSSGSQTYSGVGGSIEAEASSGSISVTDQQGALDLRASSGSLRGEKITVSGASSFTTSSGSIDMDFENGLDDFKFDLRSSSGTIRVGGTRARGTVVTGSGPIRIKGASSSGSQTYR
jgi:hypothetical protein